MMMTVGKFAEKIGVSRQTVLSWAREGKLKSIKTLGGQYRIFESELDKFFGGEDNEQD